MVEGCGKGVERDVGSEGLRAVLLLVLYDVSAECHGSVRCCGIWLRFKIVILLLQR